MNKNLSGRFLGLSLGILVVVSIQLATQGAYCQGQSGPTGDLSVVGEVSVNGTNAISGATIFSDSTVTTAKGSSAVVSLGKLGRVEVFASTNMKLSFDDSSITVRMVSTGRVRVSSSSGIKASVMTKDGKIATANTGGNEFTVNTECGNTVVSTQSGKVELRAGNSVKQIAAGSQDTAGQAKPGLCRRS